MNRWKLFDAVTDPMKKSKKRVRCRNFWAKVFIGDGPREIYFLRILVGKSSITSDVVSRYNSFDPRIFSKPKNNLKASDLELVVRRFVHLYK